MSSDPTKSSTSKNKDEKYKFQICKSACVGGQNNQCFDNNVELDLPEKASRYINVRRCQNNVGCNFRERGYSLLPTDDDPVLITFEGPTERECCTKKTEYLDGAVRTKLAEDVAPCLCTCDCTLGFTNKTTKCAICGGIEIKGDDEVGKRKGPPFSCPAHPTFNEKGRGSVIISVCWVAGAVVGLLPLFGWHAADVGQDVRCYFVEVMDYNYLLFLYFATIVTPSVLLAAFYAHIYRVVVKQMSEVMTVGSKSGGHGGGRVTSGTMLRVLGAAQKREVKATQNLAIIVFFFVICWIPLYTVNAIKAFVPELDIPNPLTYVCIIVSHLNSAINPLLYAYHLKDFRAALKGLICAVLGRGVPIPAAYRPPVPVRRLDLERSNAIRTRPKVYVNSPVWLRQKEAETTATGEKNNIVVATGPVVTDVEPFLQRVGAEGSSGRHTPEGKEIEAPFLIGSNSDKCQSPYKKVEELIRRVRSVSGEHS